MVLRTRAVNSASWKKWELKRKMQGTLPLAARTLGVKKRQMQGTLPLAARTLGVKNGKVQGTLPLAARTKTKYVSGKK